MDPIAKKIVEEFDGDFNRLHYQTKKLMEDLYSARKELRELKDKQKYIIIKKRPIIK